MIPHLLEPLERRYVLSPSAISLDTTLDETSPSLTSIARSSPSEQLTNFGTVTYVATFNEKVTGVSPSNFTLQGTEQSSSTLGFPTTSDGGKTWSIPVYTLTASGSVHLDLTSAAGIKDLAGNLLPPATSVTGAAYDLDFVAPQALSLRSTSQTTQLTNQHSVTYVATFSEKISGLSAGNFTLTGTSEPSAAIGTPATSDGGLTWSISVSDLTVSGFTRLELTGNSGIKDFAGNSMFSASPKRGDMYILDYTAPTLTTLDRAAPTSQTTTLKNVTYLATFSEKIPGVTSGNFKLAGTAQPTAVIGTPTSSDGGFSWSIPVSGLTKSGNIRLDLTGKTGLQDAAGNPLAATLPVTGAVYTLAYPNPTLVSISRSAPAGEVTSLRSVTYLVTFSEKVTGVTRSNFELNGIAQATLAFSTPSSNDGGLTWSIVASGLSATGNVHLDLVSMAGIQDLDSNALLGSVPMIGATYALDFTAPSINSIARATPAAETTNLHNVTYKVTFNEKVTGVAAGNFKLGGTVQDSAVIGTPTTSDGGLTWSIPVTGLTVSGQTSIDLNTRTGIKDPAGNTLGTTAFAGASYFLDFSAPAVSSINRASPAAETTGLHSVTYLATFSEKVRGVTAANFKLNGMAQASSVIGAPVSSDGGLTWKLTVSGLTASGNVHLDLVNKTGIQDANTNALSAATFVGATYALDFTAPTLTSIACSSPSSETTVVHSLTYLVTFAEKVTGVTAGNFKLNGTAQPSAVLGTPTTSNGGLTWSITVTGLTTSGSVHLDLTSKTGIKDAVGNALSATTPVVGATYTLDYSGPALNSIGRKAPATEVTSLHSVTYLATFSAKVTGVTAANFKLAGTAQPSAVISTPTTADGGLSWSITVSGLTVTGNVRLELATRTGIKDLATNALSTATLVGATYTLDYTLPELLSLARFSPSAALTNLHTLTYIARFSEKVTGVVAGHFALRETVQSSATLGAPTTSDGGLTWSIPVYGLTESGNIRLDLTSKTGIKDLEGNLLLTAAPATGASYTLDYVDPRMTSLVGNIDALKSINARSLTYVATFTEKVAGLNAANFTLTQTAQPAAVIVAPTTSDGGLTWSIKVTNLTVSGFTRLEFTNRSGIKDVAANPISSTTVVRGTFYSLDYTAPTLQSIGRSTPAEQTTNLHSVQFIATFSEKVTGVSAANFKLNGTAQPGAVIGVPTTSDGGVTWLISVSGLTVSGTVRLDLTISAGIKDVATNALGTSSVTGATYTLNYSSPAAAPTPPASVMSFAIVKSAALDDFWTALASGLNLE